MRRRWARRALLGLAGTTTGFVILVGVEVQLARTGTNLPERDPHDLDSFVGAGRPGDTLVMVWLGDSTAAGVGASSAGQAVPRLVAAGLDRPVELVTLARSGARIDDLADDQLTRLVALDLEADVVVISVGSNDVIHLAGRGEFRARYREVIEGLPARSEVVLLGIPDLGGVPRFAQPLRAIAAWRGRMLDEDIANLARETGSSYVDIEAETGPAFRDDPGRFFAADDYHPNDAGYRLWADAVLDVVRGVVARR